MTKVVFFAREDGTLTGFQASGHAGYADYGNDIVCAAISALTQATIGGLQEVVRAPVKRVCDEAKGLLRCEIDDTAGAEALAQAQILLKTLKIALKSIAKSHPGAIRIINGERR